MRIVICSLVLALGWGAVSADGYRLPPDEVVRVVDAAPSPTQKISPDGKTMLLIHRDALPSVAELARPMLRLAGTRIDPMVGGAYRSRF
ncbi:MAG: S9 family peptidase, partial [Acidobacteriota bacterium]|nr:S9 family peptidase [Acidobacteriota bacterium]